MPWQTRGEKRKYYTSSHRADGRVIREYYGKGPIADLADSICTLQAKKTAELAEEWKRETARLSEIDAPFDKLCQLTNEVVRATLLTLGLRKHPTKWKFIRVHDESFEIDAKQLEGSELDVLIRCADEGDGTALAAIRAMLQKPGVWEAAWNAAEFSCHTIVSAMAGTDPVSTAAIKGRLATLRKERTGTSSSRLEKLLIERLLIAWLSSIHAEALAAASSERELTDAQKMYFHRRATNAKNQLALANKLLGIVEKKLSAARKKKGAGVILAGPTPDSYGDQNVAPSS